MGSHTLIVTETYSSFTLFNTLLFFELTTIFTPFKIKIRAPHPEELSG
jgi:hypothetical protein